MANSGLQPDVDKLRSGGLTGVKTTAVIMFAERQLRLRAIH